MIEILGVILAVITFPVSIVALIVDALLHTGFWSAWVVVFIVMLILGNRD